MGKIKSLVVFRNLSVNDISKCDNYRYMVPHMQAKWRRFFITIKIERVSIVVCLNYTLVLLGLTNDGVPERRVVLSRCIKEQFDLYEFF